MTSSKALPAPPNIAFPAGTKAGSEMTLVTATPAQSQLTESLRHSRNADGTQKTNMLSAAPRAMVDTIAIEVVGKTFDYGSLRPEIAEDLRKRTSCIREQVKNTTDAVVWIGHHLSAAKNMLPHGQFVQWVVTGCGFSVRSAQNFIRVAEFTSTREIYATVAFLPLAMLYALSAKSTPPEVVEEVLARAAARAPVSTAELKRMLREFKHRNREETQSNRCRERASCEPGQVQNEIARANARAIIERFGRDGAALLVGMRENFLETLSYVEQEINASDATAPGDAHDGFAAALDTSLHRETFPAAIPR
jgi:DUF3102 family protein